MNPLPLLAAALLGLLLVATPAPGRAALVSESSWWHADPTTRPFLLGLGFRLDMDLADIQPDGTDFAGPVGGFGVRAGAWLTPWLAVDGQFEYGYGQDSGLFADGTSSKWNVGVSAGARVALPLRITPYLEARLGYGYQEVDWYATEGAFDEFEGWANGGSTAHSLVGRAELGVLVRLTDYAALSLGMHVDGDLARSATQTVDDSDGDWVVGDGPSAAPELSRFGGELSLQVSF